MSGPAYVDTHAVSIAAPREVVWRVLRAYAATIGATGRLAPLGAVLGTQPRSGFAVTGETPGERVELAGRHRFSRYRLVFELDGDAPTTLSALTYADFPGLHGRAYRALVIGSRAHVVATRGMLRTIRRRAEG